MIIIIIIITTAIIITITMTITITVTVTNYFEMIDVVLKQHGKLHGCNPDTTCNHILFEATPFETTPTRVPKCMHYASFGRGDDTVGIPHRAQISQLELFELKLLNSRCSSLV